MKERVSDTVIREGGGAWATWRGLPRTERIRIGASVSCLVVATLAIIQPLVRLMAYASQSDLHSYIPLVPCVAGYLVYIRRPKPRIVPGGLMSGASRRAHSGA